MSPFPRTALLPCLLLLGACSLPPASAPGPAPVPARVSLPPPTLAQSARHYTLDAEASTLHILVYRGGTLAHLGHNHVISSRALQGQLWLGASSDASGFEIRVPVATLIVDDNAARLAEGPDFPLNLSEDAKQGTKANMLRETLLDSAHYPEVRIQSLRVEGPLDTPVVVAALHIRGQTREVQLPVRLDSDAQGLRVQGSFALRQSDFGITPLSLALGALQVQDTVQIKFDLRARPD